MTHPVIEVSGLKKTFRLGLRRRRVEAVRDASFEVRPNEVFGIVGPNGAGKTTTIKILTGLIRQTGGEARMFGEPVSVIANRARLGYLPEGPYFYEHLKVKELLMYYGNLHGLRGRALSDRADALIVRVGLEHARGRPLKQFSKGMRQRAGLAQALINDPELVILDEPQSGLDPIGRREVRDLIFELKTQGKTVVFSSHILPDVEAVCDRVALMQGGVVREVSELDALVSRNAVGAEVKVRGLGVEMLPGQPEGFEAGVEQRGNVLVVTSTAPAQALSDWLGEVVRAGGVIEAVTPHRQSLEDALLHGEKKLYVDAADRRDGPLEEKP